MKINYSKKFLAVAGCMILTGVAGKAQTNEFSIAAGGGLQGLQYKLKNGDASLKPGFQLGLGYMRGIGKRWGLRTGLELGFYQTKASLAPKTQYNSYEIDSENSAFEYRVKANGYREEQKVWAVNIPVMLQYHPVFNRNGFYAQAGLRMSIPVSQKYTTSADQISAFGYYPDVNLEITDLPVHGFGTQAGWKGKGEYDLKLSFALATELGWRFRLSGKNNLYAGLYLDYGLNDIKETTGDQTFLTYNPSGLTQSKATGLFALREEAGDARLVAYGIKFRIGFGSNKKKKETPAPVVSTPIVKDTPVPVAPAPVMVDTVIVDTVVKEIMEEPKDTLSAAEMKLLETPILFGRVGDTLLSQEARLHALAIAEVLKKHPQVSLTVEGHTCNIGTDEVNTRIGLARATAVTALLVENGIDAGRLQPISRAHQEPVASNKTEAERKKNRRVVLKVL